MLKRRAVAKAALVIIGAAAGGALIEAGLRLAGPLYLGEQDLSNRAALSRPGAYRVLCLGESTTAMGGGDSYPRQLQEILDRRSPGRFAVINKGVPATNSTMILKRLPGNLARYRPDMIVTMMGINDEWQPLDLDELAGRLDPRWWRWPRALRPGEALAASLAKNEKTGWLYRIVAWDYEYRGCYADAARMYRKALEANLEAPGVFELYSDLGSRHPELGVCGEVEDLARQALASRPRSGSALAVLAEAAACRRDWPRAETEFKRAIAVDPSNYFPYLALSRFYELRDRPALSKRYLSKAAVLNPADPRVRQGLDPMIRAGAPTLSETGEATGRNYRKLAEIVLGRGIKLICVQYPMRKASALRALLAPSRGIVFVDNEKTFREALRRQGVKAVFDDLFAGDFGHATRLGNRLLAGQIADAILTTAQSPSGR